MMGTKARLFGPLDNLSLEDLVPRDHFYRHVDQTLDLSFLRDLVRSCQVEANADKDAMLPRFYVNAVNEHLAALFLDADTEPRNEPASPEPPPCLCR